MKTSERSHIGTQLRRPKQWRAYSLGLSCEQELWPRWTHLDLGLSFGMRQRGRLVSFKPSLGVPASPDEGVAGDAVEVSASCGKRLLFRCEQRHILGRGLEARDKFASNPAGYGKAQLHAGLARTRLAELGNDPEANLRLPLGLYAEARTFFDSPSRDFGLTRLMKETRGSSWRTSVTAHLPTWRPPSSSTKRGASTSVQTARILEWPL